MTPNAEVRVCRRTGNEGMNTETEKKPAVAPSFLTDVLAAVVAERARQDGKWGGAQADDARRTPEEWCNDIEAYVVWARQMHRMGSPDKYRRRMMQIAALAVAACESFDRKAANAKFSEPR